MSDLATAAVVASQSQTQIAVATAMLRASHSQDHAVRNMLSAAVEQAKAAVPTGMGNAIDLSV